MLNDTRDQCGVHKLSLRDDSSVRHVTFLNTVSERQREKPEVLRVREEFLWGGREGRSKKKKYLLLTTKMDLPRPLLRA